jgi:hypothetical protein
MSQKLEGSLTTADPAVVELDELQSIISEGQDRGSLAAEAVMAAMEEAELSAQQMQDLLSYFEEHGIELVRSTDASQELTGARDGLAVVQDGGEHPLAGAAPAHLEEKPVELDLAVERSRAAAQRRRGGGAGEADRAR